jgi:hypothetical protein
MQNESTSVFDEEDDQKMINRRTIVPRQPRSGERMQPKAEAVGEKTGNRQAPAGRKNGAVEIFGFGWRRACSAAIQPTNDRL